MKLNGIIGGIGTEDQARDRLRNPGRPTRDTAAALPARILDAAQDLFLTQGFEATSLNQIAASVGSTKRTLYVKIGDKADLFAAVVRRMLNQRRRRLGDPGAAASTEDRLIGFGHNLLAVATDPEVVRFYRLMVAEATKFPALANLMEEQITHGAHRHLVELLREEVRRGRLALADPETAGELLLTMLVGAPQRALLFGLKPWGRARCSRWISAAVDLFLHGCAPAGDARRRTPI
jgi:AcrR family transcriptional regulator